MLGKTEGRRRRGEQRVRLDSITNSMGMNLSKLRDRVENGEAWRPAAHGITKSWTQLINSATTTTTKGADSGESLFNGQSLSLG